MGVSIRSLIAQIFDFKNNDKICHSFLNRSISIIMDYIKYTFFSLKIINPQNIDKNILEISDQNRLNIEVTLLYFSIKQRETQ